LERDRGKTLSKARGLSTAQNARLFARVLNLSFAACVIRIFTSQLTYNFWRK